MFRSVLVANRGEIAVRIVRTLRDMGIRSVVAASIPDRRSLAVRGADAMVLLEGYSAAESYLDMDAIIGAAKREGCEAIHPGYGFLSERADFAERCAAEGITFIGPPPATLRLLGDKSAARRLAVANGVPVVPGWDGDDDGEGNEATLLVEAQRIGFPVMVKARGGGGGRGMRVVERADDLSEALASARREAQAAFGDPGLLLEKLVTGAHHVEVQVLADAHGGLVHLGERDCSVQRRRQKLIEETPSPIVDAALRERLTTAALRIARAAAYVNAGTVEFLVGEPDPSIGLEERPFYFLEVNPRLQVEHPVTEMVTGLDLVELQLRVAAGEPLPFRQEEVQFSGHAIEFRINAEDPLDGLLPSSGRLTSNPVTMTPGPDGRVRQNYRLDAGYEDGDSVPAQYDSLLEKRITHAPTRAGALDLAGAALNADVEGARTNVVLHRAVAESTEFREGRCDIGWLERRLPDLLNTGAMSPSWWVAGASGWYLLDRGLPPDRGRFASSVQWLGAGSRTLRLDARNARRELSVRVVERGRLAVQFAGIEHDVRWSRTGASVQLVVGVEFFTASFHLFSARLQVGQGDQIDEFGIVPPPPLPRRPASAEAGALTITAPLAGTIAAVRVAEGDAVAPGQLVALLEAMKMEHRITATAGGTVRAIHVRERDIVTEGQLLIELQG